MKPLEGIKVVELEGLAPGPFCGMVLSDFGAEVVLIKRPNLEQYDIMEHNPLHRGKRSLSLNLKLLEDRKRFLDLLRESDVLIDPFRPGVLENLDLGPKTLMGENPRLILIRLTGYGQWGPLSSKAGHDINYLALSGVLSLFKGEGSKPVPPLNLLADFAGGGLLAALGCLLALFERERTQKGKVVDVSMTEGVTYLATFLFGLYYNGLMPNPVGRNRLDGGAPYYNVYETKDKRFMAVGAIEEKFYRAFLKGLDIDPSSLPPKEDESSWPYMKEIIQDRFRQKTMEEWTAIFERLDACVTPILELNEVIDLPQHRERKQFLQDIPQPSPTPKLYHI